MQKNKHLYDSIEALRKYSTEKRISHNQAMHIGQVINEYFSVFNRAQEFHGTELLLIKRFGDILKSFDMDNGINFAQLFFLFCYTLTDNYHEVQKTIHDNLAIPYKKWVLQKWSMFKPEISNIPKGESYVYLCRHATVRGLYAPGMTTFTHIKTLLNDDRKVSMIVLNDLSREFEQLDMTYKNFNIIKLQSSNNINRFKLLLQILKIVKPKVIFTEIEFDIISILSILSTPIPIIYFSPGVYNLPWYNKICVTGNILKNYVGNRGKDIYKIPSYLDLEIINPKVDPKAVESLKVELGITGSDFVIGQFARMEKFQEPFLKLIKEILDAVPNSKVILAGPNDRGRVENALSNFIPSGRAIILPPSDVHVLGHCLNIGLDTFPNHSGFSIIEMMAKGIPVVSIEDEEMNTIAEMHPEDIYVKNTNDALATIISLANDKEFYSRKKKNISSFIHKFDKGIDFLKKIDTLILELNK